MDLPTHHVVELMLDPVAAAQVRSVWQRLHEAGLNPGLPESRVRPHITLLSSSPWNLETMADQLQDVLNSVPSFTVDFSYLGLFQGDQYVLFLGVTPTEALMQLQRAVYTTAADRVQEIAAFSQPDRVVFHCSLAIGLAPDDLLPALEIARTMELPAMAWIERVEIVAYHPARTVATLRLSSGQGGGF
jgi:2'-5' RNA ligase